MFGEIETFIYTHGRLDKELKTTASSPPAWTESGAGAVGQGDGVRRRGHDGEDDPPLGKCVIDREATRNESVTWSAAYRVEIAAGVVGRLGGGRGRTSTLWAVILLASRETGQGGRAGSGIQQPINNSQTSAWKICQFFAWRTWPGVMLVERDCC